MTNQGEKYDLIATGFAKMRDLFVTEQKYIDIFVQHLKPHSHILDIGCGSGYPIASYLIKKGFEVTGIDASKELLKIAKNKCPEMKQQYGDIRTIKINEKYDAILEWWCLFHLPKKDQLNMIARFSSWIKPGGILEFTTGDSDYEGSSSTMLDQELHYYSCDPKCYEQALEKNGFELLLRESDQKQHLVWIAKKT